MPQTPKGLSGDLGEISSRPELVEEELGLRVPVRRLRYKDDRNMAMRGDDSARRRARWLDVNGAASKRKDTSWGDTRGVRSERPVAVSHR